MPGSKPEGILPEGMVVLERGWLSSNGILFRGEGVQALVDSGYATHSAQTLSLVQGMLGEAPLQLLLNTHLHSDHCGGNALLQKNYPGLRTLTPPGMADAVRLWDPVKLTYQPTGQQCEPFRLDGVLLPGTQITLGTRPWQVHAAPGHDPHSVILFEPQSRVLLSADALWGNGFGVVFPELEGENAFAEVGATLDLIESLAPSVVVPGHGPVFTDVDEALATARRRLAGFLKEPQRHAWHAAKVLLKFKLLELQRTTPAALQAWATRTPYFAMIHVRWFDDQTLEAWIQSVLDQLIKGGAAVARDGCLYNE